jgi:hypothetical protein
MVPCHLDLDVMPSYLLHKMPTRAIDAESLNKWAACMTTSSLSSDLLFPAPPPPLV